ncbi:hypothetical protein GM418_20940 [Maribellus comscasis]|uniref:Uncharacterized protein n=1 Tax=Maribellus comscasis TaxID=2681766 RepID=A0A6I6K391_9BACT|nr:hypothetical protein [Maribellus comscasis]QGY46043.1 hypothetical protein GM418_20940 [Maribellus comscasis]
MKPNLKKIAFLFLFLFICLKGFSTVLGPVKIDIIGFDTNTNSIFFTRTDWAECDCKTELFIYKIDSNSIEKDLNWSSRYDFEKNREEVIRKKGFAYLSHPDTTALPGFISLKWEPEIKYISKASQRETTGLPFKISIFGREYKYYQCSKESGAPQITNFEINKDSGLLLITFQGDCFEGYWIDSLIYYSNEDKKKYCKKLTANDVKPLEILK